MTQYFDTHAHYDSGKFNADRSDVLRAVHESGVARIVDPGDCAATSARAVAIAQAYDFIYAAVGWHPEEAAGWTDDSLDQIRALASQPKVCAIGEIGLDYYWDASTKTTQETMLRAQLELALELDLPVCALCATIRPCAACSTAFPAAWRWRASCCAAAGISALTARSHIRTPSKRWM